MGQLVQVGLLGKPAKTQLDQLTLKELVLKGSFAHNHKTWKKAVDLMSRKVIDLKALISGEFSLANWQEAFRLSEEGQGLKYLLYPID
jgi:L-iditol 2-dehydrogenase